MVDKNIRMEPTAYIDIDRYYNPDWKIEAYKISREQIKHKNEYKDLGIDGHGIYFLYGEDSKENLKVYVGRTSKTTKNIPIFTRLYQHKSSNEWYKDIWVKAIIIKFDKLSFDEMRHLENYFYKEIKTEIRINNDEPDTDDYEYDSIKNKVEYVKQYVECILHKDIFENRDDKKNLVREEQRVTYTDKELKDQGKRIDDKDAEKVTEMQTQLEVVNNTLDLLPKDIWNPDTKFLDLSCSSGVYLKEIFNRLLNSDLYNGTPYESIPDRTLHILSNQLYGVALSEKSFIASSANLKGKPNIIKIESFDNILKHLNIIENGLKILASVDKNKQPKTYKKLETAIYKSVDELQNNEKLKLEQYNIKSYLRDKFGGKELNFDVVVGNPPYQSKTKAIYNEFIDAAINLEPEAIAMIVKNNWLVSDTLKETRKNMIKNGLTDIINYPIISDIFSNASTAVSIFAIQRGEKGNTHLKEIKKGVVTSDFYADLTNSAIISLSEVEQSIINKFSSISAVNNFGRVTYPSEPFRITTNGRVGRGDSAYDLENYDKKSDRNNIAVVYMDTNKEPYAMYTSLSKVPSRVELVPMYKVICGRILTKDSKVVNNIRLLGPNTVCTSSWGLLFASDKKEEAVNVVKYVKTKLFRYLLQILGEDGVIALSAYRFSLIPLQNFTDGSDIDWSQSIENIDQQLYKKYSLTEAETAYIEKTIDPIEPKVRITNEDLIANYINNQINQTKEGEQNV